MVNIKELIKKNNTIRRIGKCFNIYKQFEQDAKDFATFYNESAKKKADFRYSIMLLVHSLEKGMCFPNPRPFGQEKVRELIKILSIYTKEMDGEFEYKLGVSALFAWVDFYEKHGWTNDNSYLEACKFLKGKTCDKKIKAGYKMYSSMDLDYKECEKFLLTRHSVRDYQSKKIDLSDIDFALKCFIETPTACNRQMCRVYYIEKEDIINLLNDVVIGLPGFNKKRVQYFVITYDLAAFDYSGERQQGMFNAGLCTMNFVNGLHVCGIGSCCLQWSNKRKEDVEVRRRLGLRDSERIAVIVGAGYYLDKNVIPCSARRSEKDIFKTV